MYLHCWNCHGENKAALCLHLYVYVTYCHFQIQFCTHLSLLLQMDIDLLEAFLSHHVGFDQATSPMLRPQASGHDNASQLFELVKGLGKMAVHAQMHGTLWKPRYTALGPFLASFMQVGRKEGGKVGG